MHGSLSFILSVDSSRLHCCHTPATCVMLDCLPACLPRRDGEIFLEQCFRDVLRICWDLRSENGTAELERLVPLTHPIEVNFVACQQFLLSRSVVHKRPLSVWKELLWVLGESSVCHAGELDYEHLAAYHANPAWKAKGPEKKNMAEYWPINPAYGRFGRFTQGLTAEHLAHVIFGHKPLKMQFPREKNYCHNFLPDCPHSPCHHRQPL